MVLNHRTISTVPTNTSDPIFLINPLYILEEWHKVFLETSFVIIFLFLLLMLREKCPFFRMQMSDTYSDRLVDVAYKHLGT